MKAQNLNMLLRLIFAMFLPLMAFVLQSMFWGAIEPFVWFLFYPAVFFSSWVGGLSGGVIATVISAALVKYFFIPVEGSFEVGDPVSLVSIGLFMGIGFLFGYSQERVKKANLETEEALAVARSANEQLRFEVEARRKANHALEVSSQNLARSNAELEQFAYVASHDLQEPLRMVVGYVQLMEKRLADKLDADTREFMGFAVDGALRMQNLIQDILAYSRVSTKGQALAPTDSAAALKEALALLASRIDETGAEVDAQSLPVVDADRRQLVQLFQNLVGNAIKFCKDHAPRVRVQAARETGRWRFSVTDNGIGIAPEYRDQLFVIFKRLHTRREYPGTGIGLAICKRIVERHGGEMGIESAPGGGSVFWFTLPEEASA